MFESNRRCDSNRDSIKSRFDFAHHCMLLHGPVERLLALDQQTNTSVRPGIQPPLVYPSQWMRSSKTAHDRQHNMICRDNPALRRWAWVRFQATPVVVFFSKYNNSACRSSIQAHSIGIGADFVGPEGLEPQYFGLHSKSRRPISIIFILHSDSAFNFQLYKCPHFSQNIRSLTYLYLKLFRAPASYVPFQGIRAAVKLSVKKLSHGATLWCPCDGQTDR